MAQAKLFPVTTVGSWTRPEWLVAALRRRQAEEISAEEFNRIADDAVLAAIKYQEDAGVDIVSDGETRRDNFYSFVVEKLAGMKLMKLAAARLYQGPRRFRGDSARTRRARLRDQEPDRDRPRARA